jgi:hypothetical protein
MTLLWLIIIVLVVLWLVGAFGGSISNKIPRTGGWIHTLIVIAVILLVLSLVGVV